MKCIEYIPPFLREIREYKVIGQVEDHEIEKLKSLIDKILDEVIVKEANDYGLERYEKIYGIENTTTDIEERRFKILSKMNNRIPYTLNWLKNKLDNTIRTR